MTKKVKPKNGSTTKERIQSTKKLKPKGSMKKKVKPLNKDKISNLPDDCLLHVLSFLDIKNAGQTSILSKRWRYLCHGLTSLHFTNPRVPQGKSKLQSKMFMDFVDDVLKFFHDKANIHQFHLDYTYDTCDTRRVNTWILYASIRGVEDLRLSFYRTAGLTIDHSPLELPQSLFETTKVLQLDMFILTSLILPNTSSLCQLRVLQFDGVDIRNGEQIAIILANCPFLETLVLRTCAIHNLQELNISSIQLKELVVDDIFIVYPLNIKICAPNLTCITLAGTNYLCDYSLQNLTALIKASIGILFSPQRRELHARKMAELLNGLCYIRELELFTPSSVEVISKVPAAALLNLKCLKICVDYCRTGIPAVKQLLKNSPQVEAFVIKRDQRVPYEMEKSDFQYEMEGAFNNLKTVEMENFRGSDNEMYFLKSLLSDAVHLEKIILFVSNKRHAKKKVFKRVIEKFRRASPSILVSCHLQTSLELTSFYVSDN